MRVLLAFSVFSAALAEYSLVGSASGFTKYPGYAGALAIDGTVSFFAQGLDHNVTVNLTGAEASGNVSIHIHSGVSCATDAEVGGHLWTPFPEPDPWAVIKLAVDPTGNVLNYFTINFGYDKTDFVRHAVVIHNTSGARVACALIQTEPFVALVPHVSATLATYPGYNGSLTVTGEINVWDVLSNELQVNFRLAGLPINSTGGVHVHVGYDCASAGGHFWLPANETDPWANLSLAAWHSNGQGKAEGTFHIAVGVNQRNVTHRAVVVHDADVNKTRAACGLLGGLSPAPTASPTVAPTTAEPTTAAPTTAAPTTAAPTTEAPSTGAPSTAAPSSAAPTTAAPTAAPTTGAPSVPTTGVPTGAPTTKSTDVSGASAVAPMLALGACLFLL